MMMQPEKVLKYFFGYDTFRENQKQIVTQLLQGRDVLGVMPTGAGKSICYQIPSLMRVGMGIVISPLIALMQDQVQTLQQAGISAACLTSMQSQAEQTEIFVRAYRGEIQLFYVSPERLENPRFQKLIQKIPLSLVAVDEAHCISQWGQDFRPSYLRIADFLQNLPKRPPVCAFTATATKEVRQDIIRCLGLRQVFDLVSGFDRPNLKFYVQQPSDKATALLAYLREHTQESGIVYCLTRKTVDDVYDLLYSRGFSVKRYHAGMDADARQESQDAFLYDRKRILVATNAFGMGINKPNIAFVIHYNMPTDLESYYQEAGRAGRDGAPATCILYYSERDVKTCKFLIENRKIDDSEEQEQVLQRDWKRLRQMQGYCKHDGCLRAYLLDYFGESAPVYCGACSNCGTSWVWQDATQIAQKIISCVYRLQQRKKMLSKQQLIAILQGKQAQWIVENQLDTLSTFGLLSEMSQYHLQYFLDCLIAQGYLTCHTTQHGIVQFNAKSSMFLRKRLSFSVKRKVTKIEAVPAPAHAGLFAALQETCERLARRAGVPSFSICSVVVLREMSEKMPRTLAELEKIQGIPAYKAKRYGPAFLDCISAYLRKKK